MTYAIELVLAALVLQAIDYVCHRRDLRNVPPPASGDDAIVHYRRHLKSLSFTKFDNFCGVLPFLWTYLLILAAVVVFHESDRLAVKAIVVLFVTGRIRTLQEIGHFAVHGSLCPNRKWGEMLSDLLYHFPAFMAEASKRRHVHVQRHHHSVNMPHDPDLCELLDRGLRPGITEFAFWRALFYPLTLRGVADRLAECKAHLIEEPWSWQFYFRLLSVATVIALFLAFHCYEELLFVYIVPIVVTYPLYYWFAHVALHRWFADCPNNIPYHERELQLGRPTAFPGIVGFIIRHNIFPLGDSFHLAHSLFPSVRWNHLSQVDKLLWAHCPKYTANATRNLFFQRGEWPSAVSELKSRLVGALGTQVREG